MLAIDEVMNQEKKAFGSMWIQKMRHHGGCRNNEFKVLGTFYFFHLCNFLLYFFIVLRETNRPPQKPSDATKTMSELQILVALSSSQCWTRCRTMFGHCRVVWVTSLWSMTRWDNIEAGIRKCTCPERHVRPTPSRTPCQRAITQIPRAPWLCPVPYHPRTMERPPHQPHVHTCSRRLWSQVHKQKGRRPPTPCLTTRIPMLHRRRMGWTFHAWIHRTCTLTLRALSSFTPRTLAPYLQQIEWRRYLLRELTYRKPTYTIPPPIVL